MPAVGRPEQLLQAYGSVGTLFSIVDKLANGTASVDWHLYRGDPANPEEVLKHPAKDLWDKPNPFYTRNDFIETFEQHLELTGEAWWIVGRTPGYTLPLELWCPRPDRMAPVPHPTDFIAGYLYRNGSETVPFPIEDVICIKRPNPSDLYRGIGPVQSVLMDIDAERYSAAWNRNFFLNSAEPGGLIQVDRTLSDDEFAEMSLRWREQHQGVANAHRVAILEKATWVDRKYTQRDMQFSLLRETNREIIREAFGFPRSLLGFTDATRASAEAAEVVFTRWLLKPRLERIKGALNEKLLPLYGASGQGLWFDYDDPTPTDRAQDTAELTARVNAAAVLVAAGFDPAEVCAYLGLPEMTFAAPAPAPAPVASQFQNKVIDPIKAASKRIEANWRSRLRAERKDLERFLDERD